MFCAISLEFLTLIDSLASHKLGISTLYFFFLGVLFSVVVNA